MKSQLDPGDVEKGDRVPSFSLEYALVIRAVFSLQTNMSQEKFPFSASTFLIGAIEEMLRQQLFSDDVHVVITKAITVADCLRIIPSNSIISKFLDTAHIHDEYQSYG